MNTTHAEPAADRCTSCGDPLETIVHPQGDAAGWHVFTAAEPVECTVPNPCGCKCGCAHIVRVAPGGYEMMFCQSCGAAWSANDTEHGPLTFNDALTLLESIASFLEAEFREGDKAYQAAIMARTAVQKAKRIIA